MNFVTVVHEQELDYLKTQALSFDLYVDNTVVDQITVVVNDHDNICSQIRKSWYGKFASRVTILPYSAFGYTHRLLGEMAGWENQQLCKLLAAASSVDDWTIVLDAKTWFINPVSYASFFDNDGRARAKLPSIDPYFASAAEYVNKLYNVTMSSTVNCGVPYAFHNKTVGEMITVTEYLTQQKFVDFFQDKVRYPECLTEFYLYSGYVLKKYGTYECLYSLNNTFNMVNVEDRDLANFDLLYEQMQHPTTLTASVHKRALRVMTLEQLNKWTTFLHRKSLVNP